MNLPPRFRSKLADYLGTSLFVVGAFLVLWILSMIVGAEQ